MVGLLQKDFYALWSYMKAYLALDAVLILSGSFSYENGFLLFYPCILATLIVMTLISYEEREKWDIYVLTLPCSRAQLVSVKYLMCLLLSGATMAVICLVQVIRPGNAFVPGLICIMLPLCLLPSAIMLPFIYRLGSEKGRMVYYLVLGSFCGLLVLFSARLIESIPADGLQMGIDTPVAAIVSAASVVIFALSWWISICLYKRRTL